MESGWVYNRILNQGKKVHNSRKIQQKLKKQIKPLQKTDNNGVQT